MMFRRFLPLLLSLFGLQASAQVVYADYSDPDVCLGHDGTLWMTASSFQCTPGLPLLNSKDGNTWTLVGYALDELLPRERYADVQHGCGVWAPSIRFHGGRYYIFWGDPDYGIFMTQTGDPREKWSEPTLVVKGRGLIDPCPLWDDDGRCYLVNGWAASRCGFNSVLTIRQLSPDATAVIGMPHMVYDGLPDGNHTIEGPKLYKHEGMYYILAPAGGVEKGWQLALRSQCIYGPYEPHVVFNGNGIHQGGLVGDDFFAFQERTAYGRVVHRLHVDWRNGWPEMSYQKSQNVPARTLRYEASPYQWHANWQDTFGFPTTTGVRVYSHLKDSTCRSLWQVPNLYLRKFEGETFCDTLRMHITAIDTTQQSGFVVMGRDYCRLSLQLHDGRFVLSRHLCKNADLGATETSEVIATIPARRYNAGALDNYDTPFYVRIACAKGAVCTLAYSTDGRSFTKLPATFQAREGKWIGAKYGVFSTSGSSRRGYVDLTLTGQW